MKSFTISPETCPKHTIHKSKLDWTLSKFDTVLHRTLSDNDCLNPNLTRESNRKSHLSFTFEELLTCFVTFLGLSTTEKCCNSNVFSTRNEFNYGKKPWTAIKVKLFQVLWHLLGKSAKKRIVLNAPETVCKHSNTLFPVKNRVALDNHTNKETAM